MLNLAAAEPLIHSIFTGYNQSFYKSNKPFHPIIGHSIEEDGNVVVVDLDCRPNAPLRHERAWKKAKEIVTAGKLIFWKINLGLFSELEMPLNDEAQFCALGLALDHFKENFLPEFQSITFGASLFEGPLDLTFEMKESSELAYTYGRFLGKENPTLWHRRAFLRDYAWDYLKLLSARLPESLPLFLLLDGTMVEGLSEFFFLVDQEKSLPFHLIVKSPFLKRFPYAFEMTGWDFSTVMGSYESKELALPSKRLTSAILLPSSSIEQIASWKEVEQLFILLEDKNFRLVPSLFFTSMWDGIDDLYVVSRSVCDRTRRKLLGFCAADGCVHTLGNTLNLPNEKFLYS